MKQLDLFEWAEGDSDTPTVTMTSRDAHSATILDWCKPFADKVMRSLHEYDDAWLKPLHRGSVVHLPRQADPMKPPGSWQQKR